MAMNQAMKPARVRTEPIIVGRHRTWSRAETRSV